MHVLIRCLGRHVDSKTASKVKLSADSVFIETVALDGDGNGLSRQAPVLVPSLPMLGASAASTATFQRDGRRDRVDVSLTSKSTKLKSQM